MDIFIIGEHRLGARERVVFCDVGQGDGAIIALGRTQILIDGGPDNSMVGCLGKYMPYFDRTIEYMIVSHPDKDHFVGLIEILRRYDVERVMINGDRSDIPEYGEFLKLAADKIIIANPRQDIALKNGLIDFLYPDGGREKTESGTNNDRSIVLKFISGGKSFLFTGDLPQGAEEKLAASGINLSADILKVAHHGSKDSSSEKFLRAVRPQFAIISAGGGNKYGHPHYRVLKRLENFGIRYLRTDEEGDIAINL